MASVKLSSLRVTAEMDASGYARGVAVKTAADAQAIASSKALGAALAQQDAAMTSAVPGVARLSRELVNGYGGGSQFVNVVERIGAAVGRGMGLDRAGLLLDQAYRKFGLTANAASLTASSYASLSPVIEKLNQHYVVQNQLLDNAAAAQGRYAAAQAAINKQLNVGQPTAGSARASADVFLGSVGGVEGLARERGQQAAQAYWAAFNERMGIGASAANNGATYSALEEQFKQTEQMSASAASLRSKINPLGAEFNKLNATVLENNALYKANLINVKELSAANQLAVRHFNNMEKAVGSATQAGRLMSGEFANLGYQVNDVLTGIALGQSPFMILAQQGGQVYQILANSQVALKDGLIAGLQAAGRGFLDVGKSIVNWFTLGRLAIIGTTAAILTAVTAMMSWGNAQRQVQLGLSGSGRASGLGVTDINGVADRNSSLFGLSISEAREFATVLAQTGRVGAANIEPIVKMGKDIAHIYGVDATKAAEMLAKAYADPVRGAADLNDRLGAFNAAQIEQIRNLQSQNRYLEAQDILTKGIEQSMLGVNRTVSTTTNFFTAIGNTISYVFTKIGEWGSRLTGIGLFEGLKDQIDRAKSQVANLQAQVDARTRPSLIPGREPEIVNQLNAEKAKLQELEREWGVYQSAVEEAQNRRDSVQRRGMVTNVLPGLDELQKTQNSYLGLSLIMAAVNRTGGEQSDVLKQMGISYQELARAIAWAKGTTDSFKDSTKQAIDAANLATNAVFAKTPSQKYDIAYKQSLLQQGNNSTEAKTIAAAQATTVYTQAQEQLDMAQRQRVLSAQQATDAVNNDIVAIGRSIGQQDLLRANLQARFNLEQEALSLGKTREEYDQKKYAVLVKQNEAMAAQKQLLAELNAADQNKFDRATIGLPDTDAGIASKLRSIYGNEWQSQMDGAIATQMRFNEQLKYAKDLSVDFAQGFAHDIRAGVPALQALTNAVNRLFDKLLDAALNQLVSRAFGGLVGSTPGGGLFSSLLGGGGGAGTSQPLNIVGSAGSMAVPTYHTGGIIGSGRASRYVHPSYFDNAPRFHGGGIAAGEVPIIAKPGEGVFTPEQMAAMGGSNVQVNVINKADGAKAETSKRREGGIDIYDVIISTVNDGMANGKFDGTLNARHGLSQKARIR